MGGEAATRVSRRFFKEILIAGGVTLFAALAFSGLSKSPPVSPTASKLETEMPRRSNEPPAMVERRTPVNPVAAAPTNSASKGSSTKPNAPLAKRTAAGRAPPAANAVATAPIPRPDPQRASVDVAERTPVDIRTTAQRIADEREREDGIWQRVSRTATGFTEAIPGRKMVSQAVDAVRGGVSDLISVFR
jgi:hypothetical protein